MPKLSSPASSTASATSSSSAWWMEDPDDHDADIRLWMDGETITFSTPVQQGVFSPRGQKHKIVVSRTPQGKEATLAWSLKSEAELDRVETLLGRVKTMLLRAPMAGRQWWVQVVGGWSEGLVLLDTETEPFRVITAAVIEVEEP